MPTVTDVTLRDTSGMKMRHFRGMTSMKTDRDAGTFTITASPQPTSIVAETFSTHRWLVETIRVYQTQPCIRCEEEYEIIGGDTSFCGSCRFNPATGDVVSHAVCTVCHCAIAGVRADEGVTVCLDCIEDARKPNVKIDKTVEIRS